MILISKSVEETCDLAKKLAASAKAGDIFALEGDLGSGKTTFAKCFGRAKGIEEEMTSPTFVILKSYRSENGKNEVHHIDAYRLSNTEDADSAGIGEIIKKHDGITLIEWPEKIWPLIKDRAKVVSFEYIDESTRKITLK